MKAIKAKQDGCKVVFQCRLSYAHLSEPYGNADDANKKYQANAIIPKGDADTVAAVKKAIEAAIANGVTTKWEGKRPKDLDITFYDGDIKREDDPAYSDSYFFNAKSSKPVPVLNRMKEVINPDDAYSGCYALMSVTFFPYKMNGKKGVAAGLNSILKIADGEPLGGNGDGKKDFDDIEIDSIEDDELDLTNM